MKRTIVVFGHEKCLPCKYLKQQLEKEKIQYLYIDVEENSEIANKYLVSSVPTTLLVEKGDVKESLVGSSKSVLDRIKEFLMIVK